MQRRLSASIGVYRRLKNVPSMTKITTSKTCAALIAFACAVAFAAFQKKSNQGAKTPKREIDLVKERLKRLKESLR
jgi:hypothetical protein